MAPNDKKETVTERPKRKRIVKSPSKKQAGEEATVAEEKEKEMRRKALSPRTATVWRRKAKLKEVGRLD